MEILIIFFVLLNIMLGTLLCVASMARMDREYAKRIRDTQDYKSHFRRDRRD